MKLNILSAFYVIFHIFVIRIFFAQINRVKFTDEFNLFQYSVIKSHIDFNLLPLSSSGNWDTLYT